MLAAGISSFLYSLGSFIEVTCFEYYPSNNEFDIQIQHYPHGIPRYVRGFMYASLALGRVGKYASVARRLGNNMLTQSLLADTKCSLLPQPVTALALPPQHRSVPRGKLLPTGPSRVYPYHHTRRVLELRPEMVGTRQHDWEGQPRKPGSTYVCRKKERHRRGSTFE